MAATHVATEEPEAEALPLAEVADMRAVAIAGRSKVLTGTKNSMQMVIRLTTPPADETVVRPPLSIACVMDCSGSMSGEKLRFAKKAVLKLVKHLTPRDTLHFVTYDSHTKVVFQNGDLTEAGKEGLRQQIEAVRATGATNLYAGLEVAAELLNNEAGPVGDIGPLGAGALRRIFLFSDGRVNVGITDPNEIKKKVAELAAVGISTGSFGIGRDYDETLMRAIATSGQGRFQFLGNAQDIPKLVSKSIHDLIDLYASEASLDLRGFEHTTVSKVYGGHEDDEGGHGGSAPGLLYMGDIHSDNLRVILAELEVAPPGGVSQGTEFIAAEWVLTCQRNGAPVRMCGEVKLQCTRDRAALGEEAPEVKLAFAVRRTTDLEREVAEHLSRRDRQKARDVKAQQIALLQDSLAFAEKHGGAEGELRREVELLTVVLDRARQVQARLDDEKEDEELMARQCWQDRDDFSCASLCDLRERCNSSEGSDGDVANLDDLSSNGSGSPRWRPGARGRTFSGASSSPISSPGSSPRRVRSRSPAGRGRSVSSGSSSGSPPLRPEPPIATEQPAPFQLPPRPASSQESRSMFGRVSQFFGMSS